MEDYTKLAENRIKKYKDLLLDLTVGHEQIAAAVSHQTGIPVTRLGRDEQERLVGLADRLHKRVIGQKEAVNAVVDAIQTSRVLPGTRQKPIGSFLFLGPTGVGKTELAKALAEEHFRGKERFIRIDMSEYMEKHSVSRLIGAPPG